MDADYNSWKVIVKEKEIQERCRELGRQISDDYRHTGVTVICILDGGAFFCMDLIKNFALDTKNNEVYLGFIKAKSYVDQRSEPITIHHHFLSEKDVIGRHVLIVDDIFDSGQTLNAVHQLLQGLGPASLKSAVLLSKSGSQLAQFSLVPDYIGFPDLVDKNVWLVGYGLDNNGRLRNLKDIRIYPRADV